MGGVVPLSALPALMSAFRRPIHTSLAYHTVPDGIVAVEHNHFYITAPLSVKLQYIPHMVRTIVLSLSAFAAWTTPS